jgi:hypothetical protein
MLAALIGGGAGLVATFMVTIATTTSAECDGVCFEKVSALAPLVYGIGALAALASGLCARAYLQGRASRWPHGA